MSDKLAVKKQMQVKIGVIYSGISYQQGVLEKDKYKNRLIILPVCRFLEEDLMTCDALIFPRGTDEEVVYAGREKIREFLEAGKIVVTFGEVTRQWLPGCRWDGVVPADDGPLAIQKGHPVLAGLRAQDLHWHKGATGWCCHGHFVVPPRAEILVTNEIGHPVMYIDRQTTKGVILAASQLDAICHAYHGIAAAEILFDNVLAWIEAEITALQGGKMNE
ncbi:MAG: hypothetical protein K6U04_02765 [Armatimonadetes bacterium]|nr:hypothetical protein [Armatimonadota bacterium]